MLTTIALILPILASQNKQELIQPSLQGVGIAARLGHGLGIP